MGLLLLSLIIIAASSLYYYLKKRLNYFQDLGIPYIPGWLLLGNMGPVMFRQKHLHEMVQDVYNCSKEAKYVGAFEFLRPVYVLRDCELIKSVAIKNFDIFPDRSTVLDDKLDPLFAGNLFNMTGERWKEARNLLTPAFTLSKMKAMFELMVAVAENCVEYVDSLTEEDRKLIGAKDLFTKYTNDVIASCAFGISVDSLKNPQNDFYVLGKKATDFDFMRTIKFFIARACPKILQIFKIRFLSDDIVKYFTNIIQSTVAERTERGIVRPDMLQLMIEAQGKDRKSFKLDTMELTAQAFTFFFGGFDTTSTQMCIIAHELTTNQDVQKKLQEEIDEALAKSDGKPTYEIINEMPYLDAVFNESMRLHPQVSFLERLCVKPFELPPTIPGATPITIKPGMCIWIPATGIQRDPEYYEDPETFNPERYYEKKVTINDALNVGFGIGPRSCIGNRFATLETKILLFYLLAKFDLKPNSKTSSPLKYSKSALLVQPDEGYWLTLEPRGSN